jgi:hypothetical protein
VRGARAATALAALAVAGCGGGGGDEATAVRSTVQRYVDAFVNGDGAKACSLMTARTRRTFVNDSKPLTHTDDCATATGSVRAAAGQKAIDDLRRARISAVKVNGDRATARLTAGAGQSVATLSKEGGDWKVSSAPGAK